MADNAPNFDAMTPEEIMAWMETLAKRQGADSAGFTTAADLEIPEIDPDSVVIDEPGYIPSEGKDRGKKIGPGVPISRPAAATPAATPPAPKAPAPPPAAKAPEPTPVAKAPEPPPVVKAPEPPAPAAQPSAAQLSIFDDPEPVLEAPDWLANLGMDNELPPEPVDEPAAPEPAGASLSWLESLAVDSSSAMPEFDLSSLGKELEPIEAVSSGSSTVDWLENLAQNQDDIIPAAAEAVPSDPVNWLESLAQEQGVQDVPTPAATSTELDPVNWLESLAKRQGVSDEEFTTEADLDLPPMVVPPAAQPSGYSSYTFDSPVPPPKSEPPKQAAPFAAEAAPTDPAAWLDSLASQAFVSSKPAAPAPTPASQMSDSDIQSALKRGELVPPEQMEAWMQRQLKEGASRPEPEELAGDYDPDAPPVKADLPDWLIEQVGDSMPLEEPAPAVTPMAQTPALIDTILEPPNVTDIPDWLKDDEPDADELDSIFAPPAAETWAETVGFASTTPETPTYDIKQDTSGLLDPSDPWVEALEMEYRQAHGEPAPAVETAPPAASVPAAPPPAISTTTQLQAASLPVETEVPAGMPDAVPDWLGSLTDTPAPAAAPQAEPAAEAMPDWLTMEITETKPVTSDVPDWLADVDVEPDDIPDWLKQTITSTHDDMVVSAPPPAVITPAAPAAPPTPAIVPVRASPAPVPVAVQNIDAAAVLRDARSHATSNNLDASLPNYEALIRANASLDDVADDLAKLTDKFKTNPAVYRVLGDTLMRQGKLQAALDTYRKALNQL